MNIRKITEEEKKNHSSMIFVLEIGSRQQYFTKNGLKDLGKKISRALNQNIKT